MNNKKKQENKKEQENKKNQEEQEKTRCPVQGGELRSLRGRTGVTRMTLRRKEHNKVSYSPLDSASLVASRKRRDDK